MSRILGKKSFENIVEKGENAARQHFLLFPRCFLPFKIRVMQCQNLDLSKLKIFPNAGSSVTETKRLVFDRTENNYYCLGKKHSFHFLTMFQKRFYATFVKTL